MNAFKPGDRVRVKAEERAGHVRTPAYVRGKLGWVQRVHGEFRDPEKLAYGGDGLPRQALYMVGFHQTDLWHPYAESAATACTSTSTSTGSSEPDRV